MSIIRNVLLNLETITSGSNVIVEVHAFESFEEAVPVPSDDSDTLIPDFIKKGIVFSVKRVLKNASGNTIPELIRIPNENWRRFLSQHKERYANGPSKSFSVKTYETTVPAMKDAEILFLNRFDEDYTLIAQNSFESLTAVHEIEELIG